jgi:hypothetical protein
MYMPRIQSSVIIIFQTVFTLKTVPMQQNTWLVFQHANKTYDLVFFSILWGGWNWIVDHCLILPFINGWLTGSGV